MAPILSIGLPEFKSQYELTSLDSSVKFDDYEIVIFDSLHYLRNSLPKNMGFLSVEATQKINSHMARRSSEIWRFVESGGLVVYFPHSKLEYKGYVSNSVKTLSFGDLIFDKNLTPSVGQQLQIAGKINDKIRTFLTKLEGLLIHRVALPNYAEYEACLENKEQGQIVGSYKLHESGGAILILPTLSFTNEENLEKLIQSIKQLRIDMPTLKQKTVTNPPKLEAVSKSEPLFKSELPSKPKIIANTEVVRKPEAATPAPTILKVNTLLNSIETIQLPEWHADYVMPEQALIAGSIDSLKQEIANLTAMLRAKENEFSELNVYKLMVTSQGKPLEKVIATILTSMGLTVQEGPLGKGDLVAEYKDSTLLISTRGREGKGAIESDAASLEKWAAKYFEETNKLAKAVLIVNGYLELPLADRPAEIFPQQMLRYSTQRDHSLISGLQLLCLYCDAIRNPDKQSFYIDKLVKNVGIFTDYKNKEWQQVISEVSDSALKTPA